MRIKHELMKGTVKRNVKWMLKKLSDLTIQSVCSR
jgi:hypothetical protein